jgi:four helix bundle protein
MLIEFGTEAFGDQPLWSETVRFNAQAHRLALDAIPQDREPHLTALLRASLSAIEANVVEGCTNPDCARSVECFQIALGFTAEVAHVLDEARTRGYVTTERLAALTSELSDLQGLITEEMAGVEADTMPTPDPIF